jgi:hypothetical protein
MGLITLFVITHNGLQAGAVFGYCPDLHLSSYAPKIALACCYVLALLSF